MKKILCIISILSVSFAFYADSAKAANFQKRVLVKKAARSRIAITHPTSSTRILKFKTLKIIWKKRGLMHKRVKIHLVPVKIFKRLKGFFPKKFYIINPDAPNYGKFAWKIPKHIKAGKYRVKISTLDNLVSAQSATFTIIELILQPIPWKVDLVISKITTEIQYPESGDVMGWKVFEIKNLSHPTIKFPVSLCFDLKTWNTAEAIDKVIHVCGADITILRNTGKVLVKWYLLDVIAMPLMQAKVDYTNVVDEVNETNNTATWGGN